MTLIIAGHTFQQKLLYTWGEQESVGNHVPSMNESGLFVAADSVLTVHGSNGFQPILDGFRKAYSIPIKIWKPYFVGGYFHSYQSIFFESACFVAFAGSSIVAQHALNVITTHLAALQISMDTAGKYVVIRGCQQNRLVKGGYSQWWDDDTFLDQHFRKIITADELALHVEHSINVALKSAKKFKTTQSGIDAMKTDFVLGIQCPSDHSYKLYVYRMEFQFAPDGLVVKTALENVPAGTVAVLGMRKKFETESQEVFSAALENGDPPESAIFNFLNDAIDRIAAEGSFEISRPSSLKTLKEGKFLLAKNRTD